MPPGYRSTRLRPYWVDFDPEAPGWAGDRREGVGQGGVVGGTHEPPALGRALDLDTAQLMNKRGSGLARHDGEGGDRRQPQQPAARRFGGEDDRRVGALRRRDDLVLGQPGLDEQATRAGATADQAGAADEKRERLLG